MRPTMLLLVALSTCPAPTQSTDRAWVPATVRILPASPADYNLADELTLRGTVAEAQEGFLKLRLPAGQVRVQVGRAFPGGRLRAGEVVEVLASRWQDDHGQHLMAREVRHAGGTLVLRNAEGVPVQR